LQSLRVAVWLPIPLFALRFQPNKIGQASRCVPVTQYCGSDSSIEATYFAISRHVLSRGGFLFRSALPVFELARVLVRVDHVASFVVNANHGIMPAQRLAAAPG
jgi:hypothetical protein